MEEISIIFKAQCCFVFNVLKWAVIFTTSWNSGKAKEFPLLVGYCFQRENNCLRKSGSFFFFCETSVFDGYWFDKIGLLRSILLTVIRNLQLSLPGGAALFFRSSRGESGGCQGLAEGTKLPT